MPRSKTLFVRDLKKQHQNDHERNPSLPLYRDRVDAPSVRGQCDVMPRPCPFVGCRYHLFMHLAAYGDIKMPFGDDVSVLETMTDTCTLDVADSGPQSQYRVSRLLNLTQQAVLQLEQKALAKVRRYIEHEHDESGCDM